jgi:hypothetical protein
MGLTDRVDARTAGMGAGGGAGAYLLGYLLVYLTQRGSVEDRLSAFNVVTDLLGGDPIPIWKGVGWLFYNAHFVATRVPGIGGSTTRNFIANADDGALTLLYLLPPLFLAGGGYAVVALSATDLSVPGWTAGALVIVGYLPLAVLGVLLFGYPTGDGAIAPDAITAVLLAGAVYPAAFGAIGGAIAGRL